MKDENEKFGSTIVILETKSEHVPIKHTILAKFMFLSYASNQSDMRRFGLFCKVFLQTFYIPLKYIIGNLPIIELLERTRNG